jgi:cytoskeletal protein CcmA (bactofilin family)
MSTSLTAITNSNTFGQWKDRTNQIITALNGVVTIGDSETNAGNVVITGDVTSTGTLYINTIDATASNTANLINVNADLKITGNLQVNSANASEIKLYKAGSLTWTVGTNTDHTQFDIKKGAAFLRIDETAGTVSSTNLTLDASLFPESLDLDITGTAARADEWSTGRTIGLTGDVTGTSAAWTGNGNISFITTVADNSHNHTASNISDLSTALDGKVDVAGDTMTGDLKLSANTNVQLGTTVGATTSLKRGTFGPAGVGQVADAFSITTTGTNVSTYISIPGSGSLVYIADGSTAKTSFDHAGNIVTVGDITAFGTVSDINRKENVVRITNALDKIKKVSGYTYNYIDNPTPMTGVVAQEFEGILPEVVYNTVLLDGTVSKAVRHGNIVGLLIEAIKELEAQVEELRKGK